MSEGESDQFSLRWNNFHSNLTSGFHALLQGEDLVDVTLAAGGQFVQAHKIVLSVCSPYFKDLFKVNPCKHPIVILKDVCHKDLVAILQFMYRGEVNVRQEELATFLKTAEMLQIKGLTGEDSPIEEDITPVPQPSVRTRAPRRVSEKSLHGTPEKKETVANPVTAEPEEASAPPYKRMKPEVSSAVLSSPVITEESSGVEFIEMTNPKQEPVEYETEIEEVNRLQNRDDPLVQLLGGESSQTLQDSSQGSSIFASIPSASQDSGLPQDCGQERMYNRYDSNLYRACNYCGKIMRRSSLRKHVTDRHMPIQAPVQCLYCPRTFRTANSLQNHHSIYHRNIGKKARQAASEPSA
ncbi:broad-complex core protein isoforms 1/2/3/4/5 isoform X11 [Cryptotermes secundus]|uniref:broad-complex core protein isoforms 1/2/3/4/5 isoform X11 n=1 Tax=Cryptotermes secundus TaxID=105785 RepID=UPI000CD7C971|nr:broad-complex core protein isoforms 1/2/3/4/5 isoform X11 [Cryptotermes secundus]XP_033611333.1 broad-complex core protein isoforms 1/2/3/4/5 isoform X11 [Cryptotermes secundus]